MSETSGVQRLERWYLAQCDGDWEHMFGIEIGTLDNPGWRIRIDLAETPVEGKTFDRVEVERADDDWLQAWVEDARWHAACGPLNLNEALGVFLDWTTA